MKHTQHKAIPHSQVPPQLCHIQYAKKKLAGKVPGNDNKLQKTN